MCYNTHTTRLLKSLLYHRNVSFNTETFKKEREGESMKHSIAYLLTMIGASFWGLTGLFVETLYSYGFTAWEIVTIRLLSSSMILLAILALFSRSYLKIEWKHIPHFIGLGVFGIVLFNWFYFKVMEQTSISIAVVLLYTSPVFVAILSKIIFKEKFTIQKLLSIVLTIVGCSFAVQLIPLGDFHMSFHSMLLGILSAFFCALYSVIGKMVSAHYNFITITVYSLFMGSLFIAPTSSLWKKAEHFQSSEVWLSIIGISIISTICAYTLYTFGLTYIESSKAAILGVLEPIVAILVGVFIYSDSLRLLQIIGIILVLFSAFITVFQKRRKVKKRMHGYYAYKSRGE